MLVHLTTSYEDLNLVFERFEYKKEVLEYATNHQTKTHFFTLDIAEEDYLILKLQYGNKVWIR